MKNPNQRRLAAHLALVALALATPLLAHGWAAASHAYVAKHTDKMADKVDANALCNRIYGANAVDMFNLVFTPAGKAMAGALHDPATAVSALPYFVAANDVEKAFAFGFASHNEAWGTDRTSHWDGVTVGHGEGYVIAKAKLLADALRPRVLPLVGDEATLQFVSHILVEHAVDLLVAGTEPSIGQDLMASTACPQPAGVEVLVRGLVPAYDKVLPPGVAEQMIRGVEPAWRSGLLTNGWALTQPNARTLLAFAIAEQARGFLPGPLPPNEALVPLIDAALQYGMFITVADYKAELDATIGWVNGQMSARKITP